MTDLQRISRCRSLRKSSTGTCQLWNDRSRRDSTQWRSGVLTTTSSGESGGSETSLGSPGGDSTVSKTQYFTAFKIFISVEISHGITMNVTSMVIWMIVEVMWTKTMVNRAFPKDEVNKGISEPFGLLKTGPG